MDVALIRWPAEAERRAALASAGAPRLLVVPPTADAPVIDGCLEDWVRLPAADCDVRARVEMLRSRAQAHAAALPILDGVVLTFRGVGVTLPPLEARLTQVLLERFDAVVSRQVLTGAGWPAGVSGRNALDVHMLRLRRRLAEVGLRIRTVRSRGYLLTAVQSDSRQDIVPGA